MGDGIFDSVEYSIVINLLAETSYKVAHFFSFNKSASFPKNVSEKLISMNSPRFYRRLCSSAYN